MIRLGVAVKTLGRVGLRSHDSRRAASGPHLSVSLLYLRETLLYLHERNISVYRLADTLAPYLTHPDMPSFHRQIDECADMLAEVGAFAHTHGIRLTMHLGMHVALGSPDETIATRSLNEITAQAALLDALGIGSDGVLVVHIGGAHGDSAASRHRFAARIEQLPETARKRLAVEPDEHCFDLTDLLPLSQVTGVPLVFDTLHFQLNNRRRLTLPEALGLALATWPLGAHPEIHISTQRTEAHLRPGRAGEAQRIIPPRLGQHADFINPFECIQLLQAARGLPPFDAMLEAKASDLALLRLREDLARFAPELAAGVM
jgi:UV DNA damage endonuclease